MGKRLTDGHPTRMSFSLNPNLLIYEMSVKPPGIAGGGPNDTTSMRNTTWRTRQPKKLKSLKAISFTAQYNTLAFNQLLAMVNNIQTATITYSDGTNHVVYGWIDDVDYNDTVEGSPPTMTVTFEPSNADANGNEIGPVFNDV